MLSWPVLSKVDPPRARAWQAIAYLLGEAEAWPAAVDMDLVAALAEAHGLAAALAETSLASRAGMRLPALLRARFDRIRQATLASAVRRSRPLRAALAALAPLPVIIFKGAAAAELLYPSPAARGMADVDLLVPAPHLEAAVQRLAALGQRKLFAAHPVLDAPAFHERQLSGPGIAVDLHQGFLQPTRLPVDYSAVFARSQPWAALAPNARLLAPEDAFLQTAVHLAIGEYVPRWSPAIGALDLRQMARRPGPLWGEGPALDPALVRQRAREWGAERMLFASLRWTRSLLPGLAPLLAAFEPRLPLVIEKLLVAGAVHRATPPGLDDPWRAEALLRKALLMPLPALAAFLTERASAALHHAWAQWAPQS